MKKLVSMTLAGIFVLASLAGCGGQTTSKAPSESKAEAASSAAASTSTEAKEPAANSGELVLYNSQSMEWSENICNMFTEATGIKVNIVSGSTGDLTGRMEAEKENPQGDVLWGGVADSYHNMPHLLAEYVSPELENFDEKYRDKNNKFSPFDVFPNVIIYNTEMVSEADAPKGWADLLGEKFKGNISFTDVQKSSAAYGAMLGALYAMGKDDGKGYEYIHSFVKNMDNRMAAGSNQVIKGVADGEYSVGITYEEGAVRYILGGAPMEIVYPAEGTYVSVGGVAIIEGAPNRENAEKFIDYVLSKEIQEHIGTFGRRSGRTDVATPEGLVDLDKVPAVDYDIDWSRDHKAEFIDQWKEFITE